MPKAVPHRKGSSTRHDPLHVQLKEDEVISKYGKISRPGKRARRKGGSDDENEEVSFILDS